MGSRAVVYLRADGGSIYTRTGRAFLPAPLTTQLLDRLRAAVDKAGLFDEVGSDWLLLDAELLPWSLKADGLLREQYAAVGAAGRLALPAAVDVLEAAAQRGLDVADLTTRLRDQAQDVAAYDEAWRRYAWPTDGLEGVHVAPFQVLAAQGATFEDRDHLWHLGIADRLADADPGLVRRTRRLVVDTRDDDRVAEGIAWWQALVDAGGEGMVVKPLANCVRGTKGLVQPGLKVRGPEYLRIIYGPGYLRPANLARLRERNLSRKRSAALREYALGLESLRRLVAGEPLWRVHEPVFAVLALESEPVDPRL